MSALLFAAALFAAPAEVECRAFQQQLSEPISVVAQPIAPGELDAVPVAGAPGSKATSRVGLLDFTGQGLRVESGDARFAALPLDSFDQRLCGYRLQESAALDLWSPEFGPATISFRLAKGDSAPPPGARAAAERGAAPLLDGYRAGSSWPYYSATRFFLGLMHPAGDATETLVVAFPDRDHPASARVIATIPLRLTMLTLVPRLHSEGTVMYLTGRQPDGSLVKLAVYPDTQEMTRLAAEFRRSN